MNDKKDLETENSSYSLEKYSSAFTLSDMEIFIFPELFYSLVLANIMSPILWRWRDDKWFKDIEKKSFTYRINRVKQYIIDNTVFNLDLDTWGLTSKEKELSRFESFIDIDTLRQSNALFGYEGDKYYFNIDIRRHFGLDKYTETTIPYWKTETLEAMMAFKYKEGFSLGAGECVSLSALYAAAMFVVGRIPLEKIFLIATPLHSQNFIDEKEGFITNNRRIVTKKMWYNATELSAKARRAIENEKITIVSHLSGYIHTVFEDATISKEAYQSFSHSIKRFLSTPLTFEIFVNFIKSKPEFWDCFQYKTLRNGRESYIDFHTLFNYERNSKNSFSNESRTALFNEVDPRDFHFSPFSDKMEINRLEDFLTNNPNTNIDNISHFFFTELMTKRCEKMNNLFNDLKSFTKIPPRLPNDQKNYIQYPTLKIEMDHSREEIIALILNQRTNNPVADYALYAYRMMDIIEWEPFIKASVERNPVAMQGLKDLSTPEAYALLSRMENVSIYEENRLALPDEVWNFQRGDGWEKAIVLYSFIVNNTPDTVTYFEGDGKNIELRTQNENYLFLSSKNIIKKII